GVGVRQDRIGALLVGVATPAGFRYAGQVGTGYTDAMLDRLAELLAPLRRDDPPFPDVPAEYARDAICVVPVLGTPWWYGSRRGRVVRLVDGGRPATAPHLQGPSGRRPPVRRGTGGLTRRGGTGGFRPGRATSCRGPRRTIQGRTSGTRRPARTAPPDPAASCPATTRIAPAAHVPPRLRTGRQGRGEARRAGRWGGPERRGRSIRPDRGLRPRRTVRRARR